MNHYFYYLALKDGKIRTGRGGMNEKVFHTRNAELLFRHIEGLQREKEHTTWDPVINQVPSRRAVLINDCMPERSVNCLASIFPLPPPSFASLVFYGLYSNRCCLFTQIAVVFSLKSLSSFHWRIVKESDLSECSCAHIPSKVKFAGKSLWCWDGRGMGTFTPRHCVRRLTDDCSRKTWLIFRPCSISHSTTVPWSSSLSWSLSYPVKTAIEADIFPADQTADVWGEVCLTSHRFQPPWTIVYLFVGQMFVWNVYRQAWLALPDSTSVYLNMSVYAWRFAHVSLSKVFTLFCRICECALTSWLFSRIFPLTSES